MIGKKVKNQCAEQLKDGKADYGNIYFYPDGYAQRDFYIVGSDKEEVFEPPFTYHGFRYLYVSGIEKSQAVPEQASRNCSDRYIRENAHAMLRYLECASRRRDERGFV